MKLKTLLLIIVGTTLAANIYAQPFTKKYIMSFHTCDSLCTGWEDHMVQLAESDDGSTWSLVPNFVPYNGSVPDVVIRGSKLYVYNPGFVKRYDNNNGTWDAATTQINITDSAGATVKFVDPSAFVDSSGAIVLFFLNSTNVPMGQDPAGCQTYPCTKYFDSAIEVPGTDGTEFVKQPGHRYVLTLQSGTASDPDIFFDGNKYYLYISQGSSIYACESNILQGYYTPIASLPGAILTSMGGIPCGYFDDISGNYWTYVHANVSGNTVIKQAVSSDLNAQLTNFNTVISGPVIGEPTNTKCESPGICYNEFLTSGISEIWNNDFLIYPNPSSGEIKVSLNENCTSAFIEIYTATNSLVYSSFLSERVNTIKLPQGIYVIKIVKNDGMFVKKIIII